MTGLMQTLEVDSRTGWRSHWHLSGAQQANLEADGSANATEQSSNDEERELTSTTINFNYFTDAEALHSSLDSVLESKTGTVLGPPGNAEMVLFLDDLNLPRLDEFETQSAIALLRQIKDYGHFYHRQKLVEQDVKDVNMVAAMNPTAGSFLVNPRMQRHFATFAVGFPGALSLLTIF